MECGGARRKRTDRTATFSVVIHVTEDVNIIRLVSVECQAFMRIICL